LPEDWEEKEEEAEEEAVVVSEALSWSSVLEALSKQTRRVISHYWAKKKIVSKGKEKPKQNKQTEEQAMRHNRKQYHFPPIQFLFRRLIVSNDMTKFSDKFG
jgi:hypothetical protein